MVRSPMPWNFLGRSLSRDRRRTRPPVLHCSSVRTLALFLAECQEVRNALEKRLRLVCLRVAQLQEGNSLSGAVEFFETILHFPAVLDEGLTGEQAAFFRCYRIV